MKARRRVHHCSCGEPIQNRPRGARKRYCNRCRTQAKREWDQRRRDAVKLERDRALAAAGHCKRCEGMPWRRDWPVCDVCGLAPSPDVFGVGIPSGGQWVWL